MDSHQIPEHQIWRFEDSPAEIRNVVSLTGKRTYRKVRCIKCKWMEEKKRKWEFPSGLVVRIQLFHCFDLSSNPWSGNRIHRPSLKEKKRLKLNNAEWVLLPCSEIICLNKTYCTITPKKVLQNNLLCPVNNATKFATLVTKFLYIPISILGCYSLFK